MNKKSNSDKGLVKEGTSRRSRVGRSRGSKGVPRVMLLAGVVVILGAAWLYWPTGDSTPTGIGEQRSIVTSDSSLGGLETAPRSGDVDIQKQARTLTPEEPAAATQSSPPVQKPQETAPAPAATKPAATEVRKPPVKSTVPPPPKILPSTEGSYAVQTGAFGEAGNADREAARYAEMGWQTRVVGGNNSRGEMVFRVWIVFFQNRQEAQTFINQNRGALPDAIPVHK